MLIAVRPKLTDIEKAILEKIPQNVGNFSIGNIGERAITVTTITIALFVLAVHCPTYGGRDFRLADQEFQFNPKELDDFKRLVSEGKVLPAADKIIQARSAGTFKVSKNFSL